MLRRLHSRIIGLGCVCGLPPSPPAEVFLKSLPPPSEVNPARYHRFQQEEKEQPAHGEADGRRAPEPFYDVVAGAAGHKHVALLTRDGHLVTFGENRYGQTAAPKKEEGEGESGGDDSSADGAQLRCSRAARAGMAPSFTRTTPSLSASSASSRQAHGENPDWAPLFIDLGDAFASGGAEVSCGSNFTIVYQPGGRRAIAFGNNHVGQLGVGHKNRIDSERGFEEWNPLAAWWPPSRESVIARVVSGYNHSIVQLTCGSLYGFGSNTWGELSVGSTTSPMLPERITFFEAKGATVKKVAAGNSFTLFLTAEGRVYGCGATNYGQLPGNAFEPVPLPLVRSFVEGGAAPKSTASSQKLMRIKDVACVGNLAAYVTVGNEIMVQGSLPEYGVATHAPRLAAIDQSVVTETLKARMLQMGWTAGEVGAPDGFNVAGLVAGPSTLHVRFLNGCVAALGANSEGQLHNVTKNINGRAVNLAPAFSSASLLPVFAPSPAFRGEPYSALEARSIFLSGSGFALLVDNDEVYPVKEHVRPIELPPGRAEAPAKAVPLRGTAAAKPTSGGPKPQLSRRDRLNASLR